MLLKLLAATETAGDTASDSITGGSLNEMGWIIWVVIIALIALMLIPSFLRQKKEKKAYEEQLSNLTVGAKVTTIGLIVGTIVSVGDETLVIKTGEGENVSYLTIGKRAVYQVTPAEGIGLSEENLSKGDVFDDGDGEESSEITETSEDVEESSEITETSEAVEETEEKTE